MDNISYIEESAKGIPVYGKYDVVIAGGGIAGIAAAIAAKRANASRVLLIEKQYALGGLATLGLVTIYLPLCDGVGNQVSFGISEELLRLSIKYGYEDRYPKEWLENKPNIDKSKQRYEVQYNPYVFAILAEQLLIEEGVDILYGTSVCDTKTVDNKIEALFIENKSGRNAVLVKSVVDATGDADICKLASEKTALFEQKNSLAAWYYYNYNNAIHLKKLGFSENPDYSKHSDNTRRISNTGYSGLDAPELTDMVIESRKKLLDDFLAAGTINDKHSITSISMIPQVRMTRRLDGCYTLCDSEMFKHFSDSIGMIGDWRKRRPVYELPFRVLYGNNITNLITAGRCISVTDMMWDITRVIPACAITGEAAGAAAAFTDDFKTLDITKLQKHLISQGAKLFLTDINKHKVQN